MALPTRAAVWGPHQAGGIGGGGVRGALALALSQREREPEGKGHQME